MGKVDRKQMESAVDAYLKGTISIRESAKMYGVSKSALSRHVLGGGYKPGRPTALSDQEEKLIVKLLLTCSDMGFCLNSEQTLDIVENYVNESGQGDLFKNTRPSEDWYYDFVKRHDELTIRNSTNLPASKSMFPALMKIVIDSGFKSENAVSGFKAAGIYPLNPEAVKSKLNQGKAFRAHTPVSQSSPATPVTPVPTKRIAINTPTSYNSRINKNQLTNLFQVHLREISEANNKCVANFQSVVESVFKTKYSKPAKQFDNIAFQNGVIMNGKEAREEYDRKQSIIQAKKDQVESNKIKRAEKKADALTFESEFKAAKALEPKLTKAAYKKRRLAPTQDTENVAPITQPIQSAQESGIRCSECLVFHCHQSIESQLVWKTCYDCDKWLCGLCVTEHLEFALNSQGTTDEFCCSECLCKL